VIEELMTEGTMNMEGVDIDVTFGHSFSIRDYMSEPSIEKDIRSEIRLSFDNPIDSQKAIYKQSGLIMQRFMNEIYRNVTLNHEHILASLLLHMKSRTMTLYDLRSRLYLITQFVKVSGKYTCHEKFSQVDIDLLTDDRNQIIDKFITFAMEREIVHEFDGVLVVNPDKFTEELDYHSIRLENPVEVMANEIEPLVDLHNTIHEVVSMSPADVKEKVAEMLRDKQSQEFRDDYDTHYIDSESKSLDIGQPFLLKGSSDTGVVLVHGYMAAPAEIKEFAVYLNKKGYTIYAPRLKGHGTAPEDLAGRSYMEWVESVEEAFIVIRHLCQNVFIGGFSAGGGVVLDVATRVPDVDGAFIVNPPMKLQDFSANFVPAAHGWNTLMKKLNIDVLRKEFIENNPEHPHINYFRNPVSGIFELEKLMKDLEPKLAGIKLPVQIIQARNDPVVSPKGSMKLFEHLYSDDKEYYLLNFKRHGILLGEDSERVFDLVCEFIKRIGSKAEK